MTAQRPARSRQHCMAALLRGVREDLAAYRALLGLLEQQFEGALHHHSARLTLLAASIGALVEAIELRRRQRVLLMRELLGASATMAALPALLKGASRRSLAADWTELERLVTACKQCNTRNSALLTEQYAIMQRVLQGEDQLYAPT